MVGKAGLAVSERKAKELRWRFRFWFERGLNDEGITRQTGAPIRKVKRERARLINIYKRNEEKHRAPVISREQVLEAIKKTQQWSPQS